ncbi:hypothetical protein ABZ816_40110 [Actinosynnema sp. NPDC047251]|uniref:NTP pyrophosphohydrolase MazG putative catalytic core domain-containing protein n=1 Tax=Saccharothrix espanaensis (strain ATCC 51144 / DSM 44229 / JCM 9112 / NBRC 15066 / NRRL 15764) TaxID=1179773 RepID=K0JTV6_SACES|nr:hypothetical protein [Saccharothrix espanaensis]CCH29361.1 hypothetical protein BN6_20390 [Saccharothrix espanaensis DSM 44229]
MDEMTRLLEQASRGVEAMQRLQVLYDREMWDIDDPAFTKLRHIHVHLSVTVGKLAKLIEPKDHLSHHGEEIDVKQLESEFSPILADLLMHASQLANLAESDLGQMLARRYKNNATRFAPDSSFAKIQLAD